jgi:3-deoxy-D-manno-octulosonic-acid transferase
VGKILYRLFIFLYPLVISLVSAFNNKAKLWVNGRRNVFNLMKQQISTGRPLIWMHCASLGEFEQGRPLLEKLRKQYPSHKILLTFFSPSGFEVRKNYEGADYIYYLPMDGKKNAIKFFDLAKPSLAIFVKYEFWYYYLHEAKKRKVSLLLVSAIFRKSQPFFSKNGNFHRKILSCFTHLFVQNKESVDLLNSIGYITNISLAGDTRFDRVIEVAEGFLPVAAIEAFSSVRR